MDSQAVNKEIRTIIRPQLMAAGFDHCTARTFWRHSSDRIDVVNFQSFSKYHAIRLECTTYSFAVNLGCYFEYVPSATKFPYKTARGRALPEEYHCHVRRQLRKSILQDQLTREDIWYIDPDLYYLESAVHDAGVVIKDQATPWFERFSDPKEVLRTLEEEGDNLDHAWGMGPKPSAHRHYLAGYVARALGKHELALKHLSAAFEWCRQHNEQTYSGGVYSDLLLQLTIDIQALPEAGTSK